ncbi:MAG: hypothetical protein KC777_08285, partial [Cyanobacteria bacterium HKST-UBA02]|nr:hypothetical protein [Cyanobacteria bacterium HKST-UBA02]
TSCYVSPPREISRKAVTTADRAGEFRPAKVFPLRCTHKERRKELPLREDQKQILIKASPYL